MRKLLIIAAIVFGSSGSRADAQAPSPGEAEKERRGAELAKEPAESGEPNEEPDPSEHINFFSFDYKGKDAFGGPFGDGMMTDEKSHVVVHEEEPMSPPFVLMLLNFGVLLIILGKFGGPAASKLAQERHDQIKSALDEAAKLRDQAQHKLAEYDARIKDVDAEVKKLMEGIRADAETDKARILAAAAHQAEQMKRDAEQRIAAEIELARAQLTQEVTAAATTATAKLLRDKTTADDQKKLVSSFIAGVR